MELDSFPLPEGVDPAVYSQLKTALRDTLIARSEGKLACTPPGGTANAVTDLDITDAGGGTANLTWHYYNLGDYNQDSIVNVSDITPIAMNYGATVPAGDENLLLAVIDGSGNDVIDIADITPIAMNYGAELAHYSIETSTAQAGPYSLVQQVTIASALDVDTARAHFQVNITPVYTNWYRVVPADPIEMTGPPSNEVLAIAPPWAHTWGLAGSEELRDVVFDDAGNIYVIGSTDSSGAGDADVLLLKYSPYGDFIWARTWGGVNKDEGRAICFDPTSQSLLVLGQTRSFGAGQSDLLLLSFSTDGNLQMQRAWGGAGNEYAYDIATYDGDAYICASTDSYGAGDQDALMMKVSSFGAVLWVKTWGGAALDSGISISLDSEGKPCVAGLTESFGAGSGDVYILKYDSVGNTLSQRTWGTQDFEAAVGIVHDSNGNLLIDGMTMAVDMNGFAMKINSTGDVAWAKKIIGSNQDLCAAIATDAFGNALIYGTTNSTSLGGYDLFFTAFSSTGSLLAQTAWGTSLDDASYGLTLGADGYLYCTGYAPNAQGTWANPPFTIEDITTGTLSDVVGTETAPATLMIDVVGVTQAPVGEILDTGAGGDDALIMKMLLLA